MHQVKTLLAVVILSVGSLAALHAETIGTVPPLSVINSYDGLQGGVYVFRGTPLFNVAGNAVSLDFAGNRSGTRKVTPLLFEKSGIVGDTFTIKGVGESITNTGNNSTQTAVFNLLAGSASVGANYTFGFYDGAVSSDGGGGVNVDSFNNGSITTKVDNGPWAFTVARELDGSPAPYFMIGPGTVFQLGGPVLEPDPGDGTPENPFHMPGDGRTYQINMTSDVIVPAGVPGDYNNNGTVDAADYVLWRNGGPLMNEVDNPGTVDALDFLAWRARFGNIASSSSGFDAWRTYLGAEPSIAGSSLAINVPEPTALSCVVVALLPYRYIGRRQYSINAFAKQFPIGSRLSGSSLGRGQRRRIALFDVANQLCGPLQPFEKAWSAIEPS